MTKIIINKIIFYSFNKIKFSKLIKKNGLYVFPAAPALTKIDKDFEYKNSLINSDYVFLDSGFLCLFLLFFKGVRVKKLSGLKFLRKLLSYLRYKKKKLYLIDPNSLHSNKNFIFLKKLNINKVESYVAPKYKSKISDKKLLGRINKYKPDFILINIGGGVQEKLGYYLKKNVRFKTKIICTGAAIAFLTEK
jgi:N-acetylglucosaminyldiphosphoundecaprenol N-acetyl-beta-D-mannosaminyltransferase